MGNGFLDFIPKPGHKRKKWDELDVIEKKSICVSQDIIKKVKRQTHKRGDVCKHKSDKGLISRYIKTLKTQQQKQFNWIKGKGLE